MKHIVALLFLIPALARAGVAYNETLRLSRQPRIVVSHYYVQDGAWRGELADGKTVMLFKSQTFYVIDDIHRSYQALTKDAIDRTAAKLAALVTADTANMTPDELQRHAKLIAAAHAQAHVPDYRITDRSEVVDGHRCRIWQEARGASGRSELCVAAGTISGAKEILSALTQLSHFYAGGAGSLGMQFGPMTWWNGIERLDGFPVLIRTSSDGVTTR